MRVKRADRRAGRSGFTPRNRTQEPWSFLCSTLPGDALQRQPRWLLICLLLLLTACAGGEAQLVQRGNEAYDRQQYADALAAYAEAQQQAPALPEPDYNAGNAQARLQAYAEAEQQLRQALAAADEPLAQAALYNLGNVYFEQQAYAQAIEAYKEALRLNPDDLDAKVNLELALQRAQAAQEQQAQEQQEQAPQEQGESAAPSPPEQTGGTQPDAAEQDAGAAEDGEPNTGEQAGDGSQPDVPDESPPQGQEAAPAAEPGAEQPVGLTPAQARQLLQAIGQNTETLQERLQRMFVAPGGGGSKDW